MNGTTFETDELGNTDAVFRRVMAWATERACAEDRECEVMEALYDVLIGVVDHDGEDHPS